MLLMGGPSESNPVVAHIELSVVGSDENVAQDPDGAHGGGDVESHEAGQADFLAKLGHLHHIVGGREREVHPADVEDDIRQVGQAGAVNDVLATHHGGAAQSLVDGGDLLGGPGDQTGARVCDGLAAARAERGLQQTQVSSKSAISNAN